MQLERVVELHVAADGRRGSGALIGAGLLLTAAHVVGGVGSRCRWRRLVLSTDGSPATMTPFADAEVVWVEEQLDAALLAPVDGGVFVSGLRALLVGRLAVGEEIIVDAAGFPRYASSETRTDLASLKATVNAASGIRAGTLTLSIRGMAPTDARDWKGISGGPVFAGEALIGHLVHVPEGLGSATLTAVPIQRLAEDPVASALLRASGVAFPFREVQASDVAALPASGRWGPLRARYAQRVIETFCALDQSGLPLASSGDPRPATAGYNALGLTPRAESAATLGVHDVVKQARVVITGQPGSGKSTALKQTLTLAAQDEGVVPVWLPLSELPEEGTLTAPRILDTLVEQAHRQLLHNEVNVEFFTSALEEPGTVVIAFDALDEAGGQARRQQVRNAIAAFSQAWPATRIWLSSRSAAYDEAPFADPPPNAAPGSPPKWMRLDVKPLGAADMREFLRLAFNDDGTLADAIAARDDLESLTHTPLTVTMLAGLAARDGLPPDAASVFGRWIHTMCALWEEAKGERPSGEELARRIDGLRLLGWGVQQRGEPAAPFSRQLARQALAEVFAGRMTSASDALLEWLVRRSGLLAQATIDAASGPSNQLRFAHLQIQEYLAGSHFAASFATDARTLFESMEDKWYRADWREPLGFAAAQLASDGDLHHDLLRAITTRDEPNDDLLHRRTRLVAWLLSKVVRPDPALVRSTVTRLVEIIDQRGYRQLDACAALIGMVRHHEARAPLAALAAGTAMAHAITGTERYGTPRDAHAWRLRAVVALAKVEGPDAGLRHLDRVEADAPNLAATLRCLRLRAEWGEREVSRQRLAAMFEAGDVLEDRKAIDTALRELGEGACADSLIDRVVIASGDLAALAWACERGRTTPTGREVVASLTALRQRIIASGNEFNAAALNPGRQTALDAGALNADLQTALDLAQLQRTPELIALFDATLGHAGLIWFWGDRVRERFPELKAKAIDAMAEFVLDATLTDRSRRSSVIYALCNARDDELVVPVLLRFLDHLLSLRWDGERLVDSLMLRGQHAAALAALRPQLRHGRDVESDLNERVIEAAHRINPDVVYGWLDEIYLAGSDPVANARQLEAVWRQSGVGTIVRWWFAHVVKLPQGREFLVAGTDNARDTAFTDFARYTLYGSVFYDDDDGPDDPDPEPTVADLDEELQRASDRYDAAKTIGRFARIDQPELGVERARAWLAPFLPPTAATADELAHRLERLSDNNVWLPEWRDQLAAAIRLVDGERDDLIRALEARS